MSTIGELRREVSQLRAQVGVLEETVSRLRTAPDEQLARLQRYFRLQPTQCRIIRLLSDGKWHQRADVCRQAKTAKGAIKVHVSHMRDALSIEGKCGWGYRLTGENLALVQNVMRGIS